MKIVVYILGISIMIVGGITSIMSLIVVGLVISLLGSIN